MTPSFRKAPRTLRKPDWEAAARELPRMMATPSPDLARHEFASRVIRHLVEPGTRVAVISEHGRPALVKCCEALFDVLSKDHPIVGVYTDGAVVTDVIEDLKAAGL